MCFRRASSWSRMPTLVVSTILPNARLGSRLLIHFSISVTATSNRGLMTPHLQRKAGRRGEEGGGGGGSGAAAGAAECGERDRRRLNGALARPLPALYALVDASQQRHDNLPASVVVNNLEGADIFCECRRMKEGAVRSGRVAIERNNRNGLRNAEAQRRHDDGECRRAVGARRGGAGEPHFCRTRHASASAGDDAPAFCITSRNRTITLLEGRIMHWRLPGAKGAGASGGRGAAAGPAA